MNSVQMCHSLFPTNRAFMLCSKFILHLPLIRNFFDKKRLYCWKKFGKTIEFMLAVGRSTSLYRPYSKKDALVIPFLVIGSVVVV